MKTRIIALTLTLAAGLLALAPTVPTLTSAPTLEASVGKLNYYRVPGGDPGCFDPCDDVGVCCTFPGGPDEEEEEEEEGEGN